MAWQSVAPNLPVPDVPAAQEWYRTVLGLEVNWIWEDNFGSVGSDSFEIFLYESDSRKAVVCSLFVDIADLDMVYERCRKQGGEIVSELELKPWGLREFSVCDPGGNVLRVGGVGRQTADTMTATVTSEAGSR
jgi:catechol 2,3-dioxygenase-like lactoylglutathione lyase family enzyme